MSTQNSAQQFKDKGYVELKGFFSKPEIDALRQSMETAKQCEVGRGRLNDEGLTFNHNLYFHNKPIQDFITQQKIVDLLLPIAGPDIWIRWDQLVTKQPGGVEFPWHQDNGYNGLTDEHFQFWIAVSESKPENGGLWLAPGSHKNGVLPHKWVGKHKVCQAKVEDEIPISAMPGDAVLFSSKIVHRTKPNNSNIPRLAYVVEYMNANHFDPHLSPPYFMVAKKGKPAVGFVKNYPGRRNPLNHLKYSKSIPQFVKSAKHWVAPS